MNPEKLKKLQEQVRIGGKGSVRRKKKIVRSAPGIDNKKVQSTLKQMCLNTIPGVNEVNIIKDNGIVIHFINPKAQASLQTNLFAVTGYGESKSLEDMMPGILRHLSCQEHSRLKQAVFEPYDEEADTSSTSAVDDDYDEEDDLIPDLVNNFDEVVIADATKNTLDVTEKSNVNPEN